MKKYINIYLFLLLLLTSSLVASTQKNSLVLAEKLELSKKSYWSKLLHYEDNKSIINNKEFFLSPNGKINLKDELKKTIEYFYENPNATCKYPARYKWLSHYLNLEVDTHSTCKELSKFLEPDFTKMSVIFTSERYNSPSSVFGHTFLKVESKTIPYAINYSAVVSSGTNPFSYIFKGAAGGFESHYELLSYDMKDFEYRKEEFRDLVSFEISYSKDEINNIMLHMYEIKNTDEDYYFMSRNCSSELLKLIDMGRYNSNIRGDLDSITIPIDVVYILDENNLINDISKKYSKLKLFNKQIENLTSEEKKVLHQIIERKISIASFDKTVTNQKSKSSILLAALGYIEMNLMTKKLGREYTSSLIALIQLKHKYEIQEKIAKDIKLSKIPISNKYHKVTLGSRNISDKKTEVNLGYRYLYTNRFDLLGDEEKHGSVEFLDLSLKYVDNKISVNNFTFLNLESMPISNDFFTQHTTNIKMGMKRLFYDDKLYTYVEYALGYRFKINKNFTYYGAIRTGAYYHNHDVYMASIETALEYNINNKFVSALKYEASKYSASMDAYNLYLQSYYKLTESSSIELLLSHKNDIRNYDEMKINYNFYF